MFCAYTVLVSLSAIYTSTECDQDEGLNFMVLGDWGGLPTIPYTTDVETSVAKMMAKTAEEMNAQFVVALGKSSNIYKKTNKAGLPWDGGHSSWASRANTFSEIQHHTEIDTL